MLAKETVQQIIGKTFADKLDELVFQSGEIGYTRREMVEEIGCANFAAAGKLAVVLKKLKVNTVNQLYKMDPISLARAKGIGETSIFVAMCILEANKYDVFKWWSYNENSVKFSSFKHNALRRAKKRKQEVA